MRTLLAGVATAGAATLLSSAVSAQGLTNTGEPAAFEFKGHVLTDFGVPKRGTPIDPSAYPPVVAPAEQVTNMGEVATPTFDGHVLTTQIGLDATMILYAPSEADDPAYRAAISAAAGGAQVDYFDTRFSTPDLTLLSQYDAVHTWANYAYADNVQFGDVLADYNDIGGTVVLGVWCTYKQGNYLDGRIMTSAYCPVVSPTGGNHYFWSDYTGDGTTCLYDNVFSLGSTYRDMLALQGAGVMDGTYLDGEICHAYRPDPGGTKGDVVYSNGSGASILGASGEWAQAVANSATCGVGAGVTPTACTDRDGMGINPKIFFCINDPVIGGIWSSTVGPPTVGSELIATLVFVGIRPGSMMHSSGYELLIPGPYVVIDAAYGTHDIAVPANPGLIGMMFYSQGACLENLAGYPVVVLGNGQDLLIGS